jgi:putative N6-adenine-specific DNA methylase
VKSSKKLNQLSAFAVTAPGLEPLCAQELAALGVRARVVEGGVLWKGEASSVVRANLWLRTASRVLVRISEFEATAFFEVEIQAKKIDWTRYVAPGGTVELRVTCRKSKLYHSDAVAERFAEAIQRVVPGAKIAKSKELGDDEDEAAPADRQLVVIRFLHDECTVSADSSGALLHRRGYRQQLAKAPLRETLAAAILIGAGWDGTLPLSDPMCGSGTIPIEGALIARRIAPGRDRTFAFTKWPSFDPAMLASALEDARSNELAKSPVAIEGFDRDAGAIEAARANAERAGVTDDINFGVQPVSALTPAPGPGLVASNPPYGVRVGETVGLRNLYAQVGNVLRAKRSGWRLALLSADRQLERQMGLELATALTTKNGGIPVRLVVADIG